MQVASLSGLISCIAVSGGGVVDRSIQERRTSRTDFRNPGEIAFSLLAERGEHSLRSAHRQNILLASKVMTTGTFVPSGSVSDF